MIQTLRDTQSSGAQVVLQLRPEPCDRFRGQIMEVSHTHVVLFHVGPDGGIEWTFSLEDIAYCGVIFDLPSESLLADKLHSLKKT